MGDHKLLASLGYIVRQSKKTEVLTGVAHALKLEHTLEDQHGPCVKMKCKFHAFLTGPNATKCVSQHKQLPDVVTNLLVPAHGW